MDIFGKTIPFAWLEVLRTVQTAHPEAVLAGGCLRDLILGGEVKDLDIFIGPAPCANLHEILTIRHGWRCITQINADYVGTMRGEVDKVWGYNAPGLDYEVQIIQLKQLDRSRDAITRMDFGACQVGTTGFTNVWTQAAAEDFSNRTITMLEPVDEVQRTRSVHRAIRFENKYYDTDVRVLYTVPTRVVDLSAFHDPFRLNQLPLA